MDLTLYHARGACSQVTLHALHEAGLPHRVEIIDFAVDEQHGAQYRRVHPLGKVPALATPEGVITENIAILNYIADLASDAHLFPPAATPYARAERQSGLSFCSATLHPIVRGLARPERMTTGAGEGVREMSGRLADKNYGWAEQRLAETGWWLGVWSIIDVYLHWTTVIAAMGAYDISRFPTLAGLGARLAERPAFHAALAAEAQAIGAGRR